MAYFEQRSVELPPVGQYGEYIDDYDFFLNAKTVHRTEITREMLEVLVSLHPDVAKRFCNKGWLVLHHSYTGKYIVVVYCHDNYCCLYKISVERK